MKQELLKQARLQKESGGVNASAPVKTNADKSQEESIL
jgi:hypothetical protein